MAEKIPIKLLIICCLLLIKSVVKCENEQQYQRLISEVFTIPDDNNNVTILSEPIGRMMNAPLRESTTIRQRQKTMNIDNGSTNGQIEIPTQQQPSPSTSSPFVMANSRMQNKTLLNSNENGVASNIGEYNNNTQIFCGIDKVCVPAYQCKNGSVNTDGDGIFDLRSAVEYPKCGLFEMCCELNSIDTDTEQPTTSESCDEGSECVPTYQCIDGVINFDGDNLFDARISEDHNENQNLDNKNKCPIASEVCCLVESKKNTRSCGYRNINGIAKDNTMMNSMNISDNEANFGEFPWMMAILKEIIEYGIVKNLYQCGGSLITPSVILTAAHSVKNKAVNELIVRAGEWNTKTISSDYPYQERSISEIIIHEHFHVRKLRNDIAIIILTEPFIIDQHVNTICLPPFMPNIFNSNDGIIDNKNCMVTGWGKNTFESNDIFVNILKKVTIPIVERGECQRRLRNTRLGKHFILHNSFICAGGSSAVEGQDACTGDGGSPLVCPIIGDGSNDVNRYYQFGIVSWGVGCTNNIPGTYANVPMYKEWIDRKLLSKHISSDEYTFRP